MIEQCGAFLGEDPLSHEIVCKSLSYPSNKKDTAKKAEISKKVKEYTLATALVIIFGTNPECYGNMIRGLKNASLAGQDKLPKNVTEAYNYLPSGKEMTSVWSKTS